KRTKIWRRPDHTPCACNPAGTPARAAVGPATCAIGLSSLPTRIQRNAHNSFAELGEINSSRGRGLRNQARLCHPRQGIRLETEELPTAVLTHPKINACTTAQLECAKGATREVLNCSCLHRIELRRKFLDGHA